MTSRSGAAPPNGFDPLVLATLLQSMQQLQRLSARQEEEGDLIQGGRAYRRLHRMKKKVEERPLDVVNEYLTDVRMRLGAEPMDHWQLWHMTDHISWGRLLGLKRCHWYISQAVGHLLHGRHEVGAAFLCQLLRALHQVSTEGGEWTTACLMLPGHDPCRRDPYGCAEDDLHVIASYREAQRRLERPQARREQAGDPETEQNAEGAKGSGDGPRNRDRGSRRKGGTAGGDAGR